MRTNTLTNSVQGVIRLLAKQALDYGNVLQIQEQTRLKSDLNKKPHLWEDALPEHVLNFALDSGMRLEDARYVAEQVALTQSGKHHRIKPKYQHYEFNHSLLM